MTVSKLSPWNWFKKEHEQEKTLPVRQSERGARFASPLDQFHAEFDKMVDSMFSGFGMPSPSRLMDMEKPRFENVAIKPKIDVYGTDKEYVIEADLPGIEEKDLSIELKDDVLILSAEKSHEDKTEDKKGYYRVERSYGSFRRVLNVPEDADRDAISAKLDKGVLCVTMPRTKPVEPASRKISIETQASD